MGVISENYRALNAQLHAEKSSYGAGYATKEYYPFIEQFARTLKATTVLDYGCGKGALQKAKPHLMVVNYDPAVPEWAGAPEPADLVVCMDVLEHVEPECVEDVLDDLQRLALKGIFLTVATGPAGKTLADGRNAHLIQQPPDWWLPKFMARWEMRMFASKGHEFNLFCLAKQAERKQSEAA